MTDKPGIRFKIRLRDRCVASPREGQRGSWSEYQVVNGRKIVGRFDLLDQAMREFPSAEPDALIKRQHDAG